MANFEQYHALFSAAMSATCLLCWLSSALCTSTAYRPMRVCYCPPCRFGAGYLMNLATSSRYQVSCFGDGSGSRMALKTFARVLAMLTFIHGS